MKQKTFTTTEIAALLEVSGATVRSWIDKGMLPAYRLPGGRIRRVKREALVRFANEHGLPLDVPVETEQVEAIEP